MRTSILALLSLVFLNLAAQQRFVLGTDVNPNGKTIKIDSKGFIFDDKHVIPVMGEMHFSRVPVSDWKREIRKMRAGGITILSTYVFWNHHEQKENLWDWTDNKNLHLFLQMCKEEGMLVVLRIGPFCHGEVYQGGMPQWIVDKSIEDNKRYKLRSTAPGFIAATQRLYSNIYAQTSDMLWKYGGPVIGVQIENECRGPWNYYKQLKDMAVSIGFDTPLYTRTGWPKLNGQEEFGKLIPLFGDYADGFWDRVLTDMPGDYSKAFIMKNTRVSSVIATETFGTNQDTQLDSNTLQYPYFTCELGGGMMPSYHRRINISGKEAKPLAICKLGAGSNLPGYYMYHGGSNPVLYESQNSNDGESMPLQPKTMAETQASTVTNYNDMPYVTYDFQSPLGEMGQMNETAFHETRLLHQFLADWGEQLSLMDVDLLSEHYARRGCFEFYNDYVRILNEQGNSYAKPLNMPFCNHVITADVQPFCKIDNTLYVLRIKGMAPTITVDNKKYKLKDDKPLRIKDISVCLLSDEKARTAYKIDNEIYYAQHNGILYKDENNVIQEEWWQKQNESPVTIECKTKDLDAVPLRNVPLGSQKVAAMPTNDDFSQAALWEISIDGLQDETLSDLFLQIDYKGDVARVYADGKLVQDNFWNGKPMLVRLSDVIGKKAELRILPLGANYPVYLQKEQRKEVDKSPKSKLLQLDGVTLIRRCTSPYSNI